MAFDVSSFSTQLTPPISRVFRLISWENESGRDVSRLSVILSICNCSKSPKLLGSSLISRRFAKRLIRVLQPNTPWKNKKKQHIHTFYSVVLHIFNKFNNRLCMVYHPYHKHIGGLVQERRNSIANALELPLSCTNPSISLLNKQKLEGDLMGATPCRNHCWQNLFLLLSCCIALPG